MLLMLGQRYYLLHSSVLIVTLVIQVFRYNPGSFRVSAIVKVLLAQFVRPYVLKHYFLLNILFLIMLACLFLS